MLGWARRRPSSAALAAPAMRREALSTRWAPTKSARCRNASRDRLIASAQFRPTYSQYAPPPHRFSVPAGLLHSRAGLRQLFEPAVDLRANIARSSSWAVVQPAQRQTRGVPLVARDHRREEAVDETAPARQPDRGSPGKWPSGGGRNGGQHRHGCFLQTVAEPVELACLSIEGPAASMVSAGLRRVRLEPLPVPIASERCFDILVLTRFLHANRYPLRSKTL